MKLPQTVFVNRLIFISIIACAGLVGCTRCEDCELNGATETICETEFDNPNQYENAIADREALGATCTASGGF